MRNTDFFERILLKKSIFFFIFIETQFNLIGEISILSFILYFIIFAMEVKNRDFELVTNFIKAVWGKLVVGRWVHIHVQDCPHEYVNE